MGNTAKAIHLIRPFSIMAEAAVSGFLQAPGNPKVDFTTPEGAPALYAPDSMAWRIFKNPVTVYMGGIAAVILELAEPRVRAGVWNHSRFRTDPLSRLRRTGLAAMTTVYAEAETAKRMIARVNAMHRAVSGTTECGASYRADDPVLLDWVQATASFGFASAYSAYAEPLFDTDWDRLLREGQTPAQLYGAMGTPRSAIEMQAFFRRMDPFLEGSEVIFAFLGIMRQAPAFPLALRPLQPALIKSAIALLPENLRARLGLGARFLPNAGERFLVKAVARTANRIVIANHPAVEASMRMGLPPDWLFGEGPFYKPNATQRPVRVSGPA